MMIIYPKHLDGGKECMVFCHGEDYVIKVFCTKRSRDYRYDRAMTAYNHGIGPKVYGKVSVLDKFLCVPKIRYGFIVERVYAYDTTRDWMEDIDFIRDRYGDFYDKVNSVFGFNNIEMPLYSEINDRDYISNSCFFNIGKKDNKLLLVDCGT